jgi:hypothetical protein
VLNDRVSRLCRTDCTSDNHLYHGYITVLRAIRTGSRLSFRTVLSRLQTTLRQIDGGSPERCLA